jgi:hypothetical protein
MAIKKLYILFSILFFPIAIFAQSWTQIVDFPSTERDDGTYFIIGNTAYCGTGLRPFYLASNDMYSFDMTAETWNSINPLPTGSERQYATGFSNNNSGYIFGGLGNEYFNDLWMYNPATGNWQAKMSLPGEGRMGSSCFAINDTAYIIGGRTSTATSISEVWAYSLSADTWTQKNDLPFGARWRASATTDNTLGYLIFGVDSANIYRKELYEFNPSTNIWTQLSTFPENGRSYSSMNYINNNLIVLAGLDSLNKSYNDMWRINPSTLVWQPLDTIPAVERRGGMCFNSSTTIYYTTGIDKSNNRLKETWKVTNPTSINVSALDEGFRIYPNPTSEYYEIETNCNNCYFSIYEMNGKLVLKEKIIHSKTQINFNSYSKGLYFIQLKSEDQIVTKKIIKL